MATKTQKPNAVFQLHPQIDDPNDSYNHTLQIKTTGDNLEREKPHGAMIGDPEPHPNDLETLGNPDFNQFQLDLHR